MKPTCLALASVGSLGLYTRLACAVSTVIPHIPHPPPNLTSVCVHEAKVTKRYGFILNWFTDQSVDVNARLFYFLARFRFVLFT